MKRSEINNIIAQSMNFMNDYKFKLPEFGYFKLSDWKNKTDQINLIKTVGLGWDITDFGLGDFYKSGLTLFTIRNGSLNLKAYDKPYAEKIMIGLVNQVTPMHYHASKMEDIINRGGGVLAIKVYNADKNGKFADTPVELEIDGIMQTFKPGDWVKLNPGQSITLTPFIYHTFHAEGEPVLIGEVSMVNDDTADNYFKEEVGRFPDIDEDVEPEYLLLNDYDKFLK